MAYGVEQDRLRALLPDGFSSLRPVLRINAEIRDGKTGYVEFNTAAEKTAFEAGSILPSGMTCPLSRTGKPRALSRIFWMSALPASGSRAAAQQKRTTQAAFSFIPRRHSPARADHGEKGILRLFVPVALCSRRRARRKHWQNAARIPVPAADRLSQNAVYRAERRSNFLSAGAGKLCRAV